MAFLKGIDKIQINKKILKIIFFWAQKDNKLAIMWISPVNNIELTHYAIISEFYTTTTMITGEDAKQVVIA